MQVTPGRLSGSGIRPMPEARVDALLDKMRVRKAGRKRLKSVRYRITGFRHPVTGQWIVRNPRNGTYYVADAGRHRTKVKPTPRILAESPVLSLEIEIDWGRGPRIHYVSLDQRKGPAWGN